MYVLMNWLFIQFEVCVTESIFSQFSIPMDLLFVGLIFISILFSLFLYLRQQANIKKVFDALKLVQTQTDESQSYNQEVIYTLKLSLQESQSLKPYMEKQLADIRLKLLRQASENSEKQKYDAQQAHEQLIKTLHAHQQQFNVNQHKAVDQLIEHLSLATKSNREELAKSLETTTIQLSKGIESLTESTDKRLKEISGEVEKRLADGFEKTTKTFNDILKRLALIDDAQKKITELSTNVVSLQEVLADKRSRGAFGEVQLNALIRNVLPEEHFSLQHTLSNGKIADCVVFLPEPTGNVVIDSKFPLESYRLMTNNEAEQSVRIAAERQFKQDIKKHVNDISGKYLIEHETSDGAVMFIPAEAVFAEIHAHHADLVEYANKQRVWLCSPTTLMAILTTARSVLKDEATRKQVHIIQEHLGLLAQDFSRFRVRFDHLAKHIDQAAIDVKKIHTSADKISARFEKIEKVDLSEEELLEKV